jgi:transposase
MAKLIERGATLKLVLSKNLSQRMAGLRLGLSDRQIRRLCKKYKAKGAEGLLHGNRGRPSGRKIDQGREIQAIEWLRQVGSDFGPTFAQEKVEETLGIKVSVGTMRTWQINHGLHKPRRRKDQQQFKRRERKRSFGMMVQIDGSPEDWFEGRAEPCMLITIIDDATGTIMARFETGETSIGIMRLLKTYVTRFGRPHMVYSDHGGAYHVNVGNADGDKITQVERALVELGIELVHAGSPQAKGRVERNHKTNQDRLIKEMRLRNISSIDEANRYLEEEYLPWFNQRFTVAPAASEDAHRPVSGFDLDKIFSIQEHRIVQNDGVIQYEKTLLQITKNRIYAQPKSKVMVCLNLDRQISLWAKDVKLEYELITKRNRPQKQITVTAKQPKPVSLASKAWANGSYAEHLMKIRLKQRKEVSATPQTMSSL